MSHRSDNGQPPLLIDTHAHLDDGRFDRDLAAALSAAAAVGVRQIINIGYRPARWQTTIELAQSQPGIAFTLGLHPHHADEFSDALLAYLAGLIERERPVALGEIGLDYFRDFSDRNLQRRAFAAQLELAGSSKLPVVIHMRGEVEDDLRATLDSAPSDLVCILHSFDGTAELADYAVERGFLFGVGGLSTRTSNVRLREILHRVPLDRLLLETDAPYLAPAGVKDRRNSPANIPLIAASLAELKDVSFEEIAHETTANATRVFGLTLDQASLAGSGMAR